MSAWIIGRFRGISYDESWARAITERHGRANFVDISGDKPSGIESADWIYVLHAATAQGVKIPKWLYGMPRAGRLVVLTGNDYKHIAEKQYAIDKLNPDLVGTLAPGMPYRNAVHIPHALDPAMFRRTRDFQDRQFDIGFRGYRYPDDLGDDERNRCVDAFAGRPGCDVRFEFIADPPRYADFLNNCRATVMTEAGMPGHKAISSRQFEAIGCGTMLIGYEGMYSGILKPHHYIALAKDHSNIEQCIAAASSYDIWKATTDAALHYCMMHHTYAHRMEEVHNAIRDIDTLRAVG